MTSRERYIRTLRFATPDRIPFSPGDPRESTLTAWRTQGLPADVDWRVHVCKVLGIPTDAMPAMEELNVDLRLIPRFEERVLEHQHGHLVVQDWKGNICEISDRYDVSYLRTAKDFVTRRWIRCPVRSRDDWKQMQQRYDAGTPGRWAPVLERQSALLSDRQGVLTFSVPGPFWQMREWCGFEGLCLLMARQPDFVDEMAAFWTDFVAAMLDRILSHIVPDVVLISEDMAYKGRAMISPAMTRRFCQPSWQRWSAQLRAAGCPLLDMDSDGFVGDLLPLWIESGFNVCNPVEVAALNDLVVLRRRFGRQMAYRGGVDKRAMARGGPAIEAELQRLEPVVRDGGFIPGCDHAVPPDVSWPDYVSYGRLLARMTGWL